MTLRELLVQGRTLLSSADPSSANIENPYLDASLLLAEVLHTNREGLFIRANDEASAQTRLDFQKLLERRLGGECAAYILGRREFMGLEFKVNPGVLVPRPETEILVEKALEAGGAMEANGKKIRLLDLCTGSGAIAVSLKNEKPNWEIWASDISEEALETAKENSKQLLPNGSAVYFIQSDIFLNIEGFFDLIVSNPPYVFSAEIEKLAPEVKKEPLLALDGGRNGLDLIRRIVSGAGTHLNPGGALLLEADPRQTETIARLLREAGFIAISTGRDLTGRERVISGLLP